MKLLLESAIIFFGTLMAAGFVALGEPARVAPSASVPPSARHAVNKYVDSQRTTPEPAPASGMSR